MPFSTCLRRSVSASCVLGCAVAAAVAATEVITLNDGQRIDAPIIRQNTETVIVDLGYDVLRIPRRHVREIAAAETSSDADSSGQAVATDDLYSTRDMPPRSVKQLAERFGEGVVLVSSPSGRGSGFFISPEGYLLTNFHVIENETKLAVTIFRQIGREFKREKVEEVDIIATNPFLDMALLRIELPEQYKPVILYLSGEDRVRDGDAVFAIGNPLGLERSVSEGIVSRRNRALQGLLYIQTTTQINPGNSGGPLFNRRGQVVGVTNMKIPFGEGLAFAIPIRYAIDMLRNRDAFAYDSQSSSAGFRYLQPNERTRPESPKQLLDNDKSKR